MARKAPTKEQPPTPELSLKAVLDAVLLSIHGVEAGELNGMPAYFVGKRMFACIANGGVGIRLPAGVAANLQFSNANVEPFLPNGRTVTREWIQINHLDPHDYEADLEIFRSSIDFVRASRT
jgi:hypothetical protein